MNKGLALFEFVDESKVPEIHEHHQRRHLQLAVT